MRYKKSAYRMLNRHGETPDAPFETDFFGLRYEGNLRDGIEFALYYYGAFEKPLLFFMRDSLQALNNAHSSSVSGQASNASSISSNSKSSNPISCYCDIGANIGQHALFMSNHADRVHAFEPFDVVRNRLTHHIELNGISNITVHGVGLGEATAELDFYAPTGSNRGIGSFLPASADKGNVQIGKLQVVQGDEYFAAQNITDLKLMKIDVEGLEKAVLRGLEQTLEKFRPIVVCELTYGEPDSFTCLDELRATLPKDYEIYHFNTRKADGSTDRRRGSKAKRTGAYNLLPLTRLLDSGQDDLVAIPREQLSRIPLSGP